MAVTTGPKIPVMVEALAGDSYLAPGNLFLRMFQALIQSNVIQMDLADPPAAPSNGDTYIPTSPATGPWTGQEGNIAIWTTDDPDNPTGIWEFWVPRPGWIVGNQADSTPYIYDGSGWNAIGGGGGGIDLQTNGVDNPSQSVLNLTSAQGDGSNSSLKVVGSGGEVDVQAVVLQTLATLPKGPDNHIVTGQNSIGNKGFCDVTFGSSLDHYSGSAAFLAFVTGILNTGLTNNDMSQPLAIIDNDGTGFRVTSLFGSIEHVSISTNILTITFSRNDASPFPDGVIKEAMNVTFENVSVATFLNDQNVKVTASADGTHFTAPFVHADYDAADTGNFYAAFDCGFNWVTFGVFFNPS